MVFFLLSGRGDIYEQFNNQQQKIVISSVYHSAEITTNLKYQNFK